MKGKLFIGALTISAMTVAANAGTILDDFSGASLNPMWTLHDAAANYTSGGGFAQEGANGWAVFNNIYTEAYGSIQTPVDASGDIRVDAVVRTNHAYAGNWGNGVKIYFDANNWVGLNIGTAGGQYGWVKVVNNGGSFTYSTGNTENDDLRYSFLMAGIKLTATQIEFYGSSIAPPASDHYGDTDFDAHSSIIPEFTMARPAGFTGSARVIIGKGVTNSTYTNPYLDNNISGFDTASTAYGAPEYIDSVRIITPDPVPEPASLGLLALVGLPMLSRRNRRA